MSSYLVTCSCGKTCIVVWSLHLEKYVAQDKRWRFGSDYWTCGERGHWQKECSVVAKSALDNRADPVL